MIRIISGAGFMGGSTIAFINLVNLLNKNGHDAIFYSPHDWVKGQCRSEKIDGTFINDYFDTPRQTQLVLRDYNTLNNLMEGGDTLICHLLPLISEDLGVSRMVPKFFDTSKLNKVIYACHETDIYPVTNINEKKFDLIHYVSEFQRDWHDYKKVPSVVIPNVISPIEKKQKTISYNKVGGVIGTIGRGKQTHVAIQAALDDGCDKVLVFGTLDIGSTNPKSNVHKKAKEYWETNMVPVSSPKVDMVGLCDDKSLMYSNLDVVYHASPRESFNYIEKECALLGIKYVHVDNKDDYTPPTLASDKEILAMWEKVLA
tara:strand:+ start:76 stop:1020 length:945 start_codon:yes stop_codon:yes gene_type:complete